MQILELDAVKKNFWWKRKTKTTSFLIANNSLEES